MSKFTPKIAQPFSSDTREEMRELSDKAERYKQKLDSQWASLKKEAGDLGGKALVIGGVVAGVYLLMDALLPEEEGDDEEEEVAEAPRRRSAGMAVGSAIGGLIWTVALGIAKQKIADYISSEFVTSRKSEEQRSSEDIIGQDFEG